jgi:DNA polymerase III subunit beta
MLKSVAYAQSTDETRYILNGVYFNFRTASWRSSPPTAAA